MLYAYTEQKSQQPNTNRTLKKKKSVIQYKARLPYLKKKIEYF